MRFTDLSVLPLHLPKPQQPGCPILRASCDGWDVNRPPATVLLVIPERSRMSEELLPSSTQPLLLPKHIRRIHMERVPHRTVRSDSPFLERVRLLERQENHRL